MSEPNGAPAGTDPVVTALLRNRIRYAPNVAAQAVIELAGSGLLRVEHDEGDFAAVSVEPGLNDLAVLPPWSVAVLDRLDARALPDAPTPLSVLTTVDGTDFWDWRLRFETALVKRAEQDGLIERRLGPRQTMAVVCGLTLAAAAAVGTLSDWRLSDSGKRTVQEADAALARTAESPRSPGGAVRSGIMPLPADHVWSSHGSTWRIVGLGSRFGDAQRLPRQVRESMPERRVLPCQVVKRWSVPGGRERDPAYCCAFDDGASSFTWTFAIPERIWHDLRIGETVLLDFSPRRHRFFEVRAVGAPPAL